MTRRKATNHLLFKLKQIIHFLNHLFFAEIYFVFMHSIDL